MFTLSFHQIVEHNKNFKQSLINCSFSVLLDKCNQENAGAASRLTITLGKLLKSKYFLYLFPLPQ